MNKSEEGPFKPKGRLAVFENILEGRNAEDDLSVCSDDLIIDDDDYASNAKKCKRSVKLVDEPLNLICKWRSCEAYFEEYLQYDNHLREHIENVYINNEKIFCLFGNCPFNSTNYSHAKQHISYHGYHEKLVNIGRNVVQREALPDCTQEYNFIFPLNPDGYDCEWQYCNSKLMTICDFIEHVKMHVNGNPKSSSDDYKIECGWKGCTKTVVHRYKLGEHVHVHTKEKALACPICGNLFASKTRFCDHRKRQLPIEEQSYQCSQCSKLFATEKLLRDHMRCHVNQYKCSMCDMTCSKPSVLATHIRFRHINERPFKCKLCDHSSITKQNLELHLVTHCAEKLLACDECEFRCRSMYGLDKHCEKKHGHSYTQTYECHVCKKTYDRGTLLTKHLMKIHEYCWPSGHSRFRYKEDPDGIFRLQTLRYESLEVTKEIIQSSTNPPDPSLKPVKYNLRKRNVSGESKFTSYELNIVEQKHQTTQTTNNNILITISDVDAKGNIINSQIIESQEIAFPDATTSDTAEVINAEV